MEGVVVRVAKEASVLTVSDKDENVAPKAAQPSFPLGQEGRASGELLTGALSAAEVNRRARAVPSGPAHHEESVLFNPCWKNKGKQKIPCTRGIEPGTHRVILRHGSQ